METGQTLRTGRCLGSRCQDRSDDIAVNEPSDVESSGEEESSDGGAGGSDYDEESDSASDSEEDEVDENQPIYHGCEVPLASKDSICEHCHGRHDVSFFIELPIVTQLQSMFKRPQFYESLGYRFNRVKKNHANIEDIYDSNIYKENVQNVYLTINELSYKLRTRKENTILAGIWFGKKKPNPNLFLVPLERQLSSLKINGAVMVLPDNANVLIRGMLLGAVADLPAKASFMRFIQYNGAFSCFNCMASGVRFDLGNSTVQVFPYFRDLELRNNNDVAEFAEQAVAARRVDPKASVYGIKGHSILSVMLPNLILCMAQDVIHGVYLNVQKTLMAL
ncbi:Protein NYNRIN [Frankliniella fusca]|uniref:Protein NYNRIN n=1 Tax=Frankliniella fusca TaxID=407009 RepID=A0AAE1HEN0_9NEOP|nr:Protein NYNRIN [Frankliniella fusca]